MAIAHVSESLFAAVNTSASDQTFGRNIAEYQQLIELLAIMSIALWVTVLATILVRFVVCHVWYRRRYPLQRDNPPT